MAVATSCRRPGALPRAGSARTSPPCTGRSPPGRRSATRWPSSPTRYGKAQETATVARVTTGDPSEAESGGQPAAAVPVSLETHAFGQISGRLVLPLAGDRDRLVAEPRLPGAGARGASRAARAGPRAGPDPRSRRDAAGRGAGREPLLAAWRGRPEPSPARSPRPAPSGTASSRGSDSRPARRPGPAASSSRSTGASPDGRAVSWSRSPATAAIHPAAGRCSPAASPSRASPCTRPSTPASSRPRWRRSAASTAASPCWTPATARCWRWRGSPSPALSRRARPSR